MKIIRLMWGVVCQALTAMAIVIVLYFFLMCYGCFRYGDNPPGGYPWWMGG